MENPIDHEAIKKAKEEKKRQKKKRKKMRKRGIRLPQDWCN